VTDTATAPKRARRGDDYRIRRFLRSGFEFDGYSVSEAENGREAIRAATLRPTDLIILDLALPDLDDRRCSSASLMVERSIIILSVEVEARWRKSAVELGRRRLRHQAFAWPSCWRGPRSCSAQDARHDGDSIVADHRLKIDLAARNVFIDEEA